MINLEKFIASPEYSFLQTNPHLNKKIMFLTLGGSYAYGTNVAGSDIDLRGCVLPSESDLLGLTDFEQYADDKTDSVLYSVDKLMRLLIKGNPYGIEMVGCRPESYIQVSPAGKLLLDNASLFLSQKVADSFGGYANQQLMRLKNAVARDRLPEEEKMSHVLEACQRTIGGMNARYATLPEGGITLTIGESAKANTSAEIFIDVNLQHYPLRDFVSIWRELNDVCKNYGALNNRNHKKDDVHLNKHMMHLVRLYVTAIDILEKGQIIIYREQEHDLLMSIRNGAYMDKQGQVIPEFYKMLEQYRKRYEYAATHTSLPVEPDYSKINDLAVEINRFALSE